MFRISAANNGKIYCDDCAFLKDDNCYEPTNIIVQDTWKCRMLVFNMLPDELNQNNACTQFMEK